MEAHAEHVHHHHHHDEVEAGPTAWTDGKRYAWLLGIIVPLSPFLAFFWVTVTGLGAMWFLGPALVFGIFPLLDMAIGMDPANPPDSVLKFLEPDRYYRSCTYLFIPIQYGGFIFACLLGSRGDLILLESSGLGASMAAVGGS